MSKKLLKWYKITFKKSSIKYPVGEVWSSDITLLICVNDAWRNFCFCFTDWINSEDDDDDGVHYSSELSSDFSSFAAFQFFLFFLSGSVCVSFTVWRLFPCVLSRPLSDSLPSVLLSCSVILCLWAFFLRCLLFPLFLFGFLLAPSVALLSDSESDPSVLCFFFFFFFFLLEDFLVFFCFSVDSLSLPFLLCFASVSLD